MQTVVQDRLPTYSWEDLHFLLWLKTPTYFFGLFLVNPKTSRWYCGLRVRLGGVLPMLFLHPMEQDFARGWRQRQSPQQCCQQGLPVPRN